MARMEGNEIREDGLEGLTRGTVKRIVMAGAGACTDETQRNIDEYHHVGTGSMRANVRPGNYHEGMGSGSVNVYPQDEDSKGVGNALKAFVIDRGIGQRPNTKRSRGRTPNKTGDRFLTKKTARKAEEAVARAMEAEFDRIIEENNS